MRKKQQQFYIYYNGFGPVYCKSGKRFQAYDKFTKNLAEHSVKMKKGGGRRKEKVIEND